MNPPESGLLAARTRFLLLIIVVLCLTINWANILAFNFTVICMTPKLEEKQLSNSTNFFNYEFSNAQKSRAMVAVAVGALLANIPVVTMINWYGPRYLFTAVGFFGAVATAMIPTAIKLGFNWFLAVRFLQGVAFAGDMATFGHFISYWTYKKQYAFFTATLCTYVELAPVFTNPVAGLFCDSSFGWPGVYYFHSITTIVLFSLFFLSYRNDPDRHPFVNDLEKNKISRGRDTEDENAKRNVPYKQILTSPAAWAVFVGAFGNYVGINLLFQFTPTYLNKVQNFEVLETGLLGAVPPLLQGFMKEFSGFTNDKISSKIMSETFKTKLYNSIAFFLFVLFLVVLSFIPAGSGLTAMIILTAGATLLGFNTGGFYKSGSLISGPYSPFVMGQVSNALTLAMLVTPLIVNPLTPDNTRQQWALAFYAVASIMVAANIFYVLFASAETQPWAAQEHFKEKRSGSQQFQNSFNKKVFDAENVKRKEKTKW